MHNELSLKSFQEWSQTGSRDFPTGQLSSVFLAWYTGIKADIKTQGEMDIYDLIISVSNWYSV